MTIFVHPVGIMLIITVSLMMFSNVLFWLEKHDPASAVAYVATLIAFFPFLAFSVNDFALAAFVIAFIATFTAADAAELKKIGAYWRRSVVFFTCTTLGVVLAFTM